MNQQLMMRRCALCGDEVGVMTAGAERKIGEVVTQAREMLHYDDDHLLAPF